MSTAFDVVIEMTRHEGDPRSRARTTRRRTHRTREGRPRQLRQGAGSAHPTRTSRSSPTWRSCARPSPTGLATAIRADAEHIGRLSAATIERFACDAGITRILTKGRSEPLDVGRATRVISPTLWKALVGGDRGCVKPGCDRPPGWSEVHHRKPWSRGGPTNLANCELRCWQHHRDEHEGHEQHPEPVPSTVGIVARRPRRVP